VFILISEFGDWGLGIGQSPIPNPQSPIIVIIKVMLNFDINIIDKFFKLIITINTIKLNNFSN